MSGAGDGPAERMVSVNGSPCRIWEKGRGEPVFYLAGLAGLPRWTGFLDALAEHRRVVAPSLPGFPGGLGHDRLDSPLDWIAATLDLLEAAGMDGADLIGASVGGTLAAEVAALAPGLVRRLVLIAPFGLYDESVPPTDVWAQRPGAEAALLCHDPAAFEAFVAPPEGADPGEWSIARTRAAEAAARLLWPLADTRLERRLHRLRAPTLLLWGAADRILAPAYAARFDRAIAGRTEVVVLPGAGHLADLEAGPAAAAAALRWLS